MFIYRNENPDNLNKNDCAVRAVATFTQQNWETVYYAICAIGGLFHDMPHSNKVWGQYLVNLGYVRNQIPNTCPLCYTVKQFCIDFPKGRYLLTLEGHVVAVIDGDYYDTWDSGDETALYYWEKG